MSRRTPVRTILGYIVMMGMGSMFLMMSLGMLLGGPTSVEDLHLQSVTGRLAAIPEVNATGKSPSVRIRLQEYPGEVFGITGSAFGATRYAMITDYAQPGDTVTLQVRRTDEEALSAGAVCGFRRGPHVFLKPEDYCREEHKDNRGAGMVALIMGVGMVLGMVYDVRQRRRKQNNTAS
jgi:hypothetical protein